MFYKVCFPVFKLVFKYLIKYVNLIADLRTFNKICEL